MKASQVHILSKVDNLDFRGWLQVKIQNIGQRYLCYGTKVEIIERHSRYEKIKIIDGPFRDLIAIAPLRVKLPSKNCSYFEEEAFVEEKPAKIFLKLKTGSLIIKNLGTFDIILDTKNIVTGNFFLEIPSHPHTKVPRHYLNERFGGSKFAETWFRIVSPCSSFSESFLHYGKQSRGCLTVNQKGSWNSIYYHLIKARLGRLNIGTLVIS